MNSNTGPLKMERTKRYTVYTAAIGVWITGALWLIFHYFLQTKGKFGMQQHPLEVWWLKLHGAFSFASIFVLGLLWTTHIVRGWNVNWRRKSGGTLAGTAILLTLTGYLLYYIDADTWRQWNTVTHWVIGLAAGVLFFVHWLSKSMPKRNRS